MRHGNISSNLDFNIFPSSGFQDAYKEYVHLLPGGSRSRLEASKQLGEFYSRIINEQAWIKEMETYLLKTEIVRNVDAASSLLIEHQNLQIEIKSHEKNMRQSIAIGN